MFKNKRNVLVISTLLSIISCSDEGGFSFNNQIEKSDRIRTEKKFKESISICEEARVLESNYPTPDRENNEIFLNRKNNRYWYIRENYSASEAYKDYISKIKEINSKFLTEAERKKIEICTVNFNKAIDLYNKFYLNIELIKNNSLKLLKLCDELSDLTVGYSEKTIDLIKLDDTNRNIMNNYTSYSISYNGKRIYDLEKRVAKCRYDAKRMIKSVRVLDKSRKYGYYKFYSKGGISSMIKDYENDKTCISQLSSFVLEANTSSFKIEKKEIATIGDTKFYLDSSGIPFGINCSMKSCDEEISGYYVIDKVKKIKLNEFENEREVIVFKPLDLNL